MEIGQVDKAREALGGVRATHVRCRLANVEQITIGVDAVEYLVEGWRCVSPVVEPFHGSVVFDPQPCH